MGWVFLSRHIRGILMNKPKDNLIIDTLNQQPQQGMELLMETYTGLVFKVISFHLSNPEDIKECTNDTFAEFYFHRASYNAGKASLPVYLTAIARYLAISRYRKEKKHMENDTLVESPVEDKAIFLAEVRADLSRALKSLKPNELQIIRMKYYGGMTISEIANSLQLPYETVKKRHQRSILKLRQALLLSLIFFVLAIFSVSTYAVLRHFNIIPPLFSIEKTREPEESTESAEEETSEEETDKYSSHKNKRIAKMEKKKANLKEESMESFSDIRISTETRNNTKASTPEQNEGQKKDNTSTISDISSDSSNKQAQNEIEQEWNVPENYKYIPDYGIKKASSNPSYTLEATAFAEDEETSISLVSASLINKKLTVKIQAVSKTKPFSMSLEEMEQNLGQNYTRSVSSLDSYVYYGEKVAAICMTSQNTPGNGYLVSEIFENDNFEPVTNDNKEISLTVKCFDLSLSFTLVQTEEQTLTDDSLYQMKKYGGLMIQPRLEEGHLKIAIHTLNKDDYITLPGLVRGAWGDSYEDGILTATDEHGKVLEGDCIRYYPGCETYLEWDFGIASPGTYSLHIPFLCQIPAESEATCFPLNFTDRTWNPQVYTVPGGKIWVNEISEPYSLPEDDEEYQLYNYSLYLSEKYGIPIEESQNPDNYTYQKLTLSFVSDEENHKIQAFRADGNCENYPSCTTPNGVSGTITKLLSTDLKTHTVTYQVKFYKDVQDPSKVEFTIYPREKTGYMYTPLYYRWDESFDFTFTVK